RAGRARLGGREHGSPPGRPPRRSRGCRAPRAHGGLLPGLVRSYPPPPQVLLALRLAPDVPSLPASLPHNLRFAPSSAARRHSGTAGVSGRREPTTTRDERAASSRTPAGLLLGPSRAEGRHFPEPDHLARARPG